MQVSTGVFLDQGFTAAGAIRLSGAVITGTLSCRGAKLNGHNNNDNALAADGMKVGGNVFLNQGFTADGTIRLSSADISGQLSCRGAKLNGQNNNSYALTGHGMKVGGNVFLDQQLTAAGAIGLPSVRVGGSVVLRPASLAGSGKIALDAAGAQITGPLVWAPTSQVLGLVSLEGATAGELVDDWREGRPGGFWPTGGQLSLDGFTYDRFGGYQQTTVGQRLDWIRGQYWRSGTGWLGYVSQPYEQLAAVYRRAGQDSQARKVSIARRTDLRRYGNLNSYRKAGNWLLDQTIKYGYESWRAVVGLAAVFVIFTWLSLLAQQHHLLIPVGEGSDTLHPTPSATRCTDSYPCFYPPGYAIDTVIPIINVHQADNWGPNGNSPWGRAFLLATWIATGLGWGLTTLLVAGYFAGPVHQE